MRTHLNRRVAAAAIVPVLALGLAACSDDDDNDASADPTPTQAVSEDAVVEPSEAASEDPAEAAPGGEVAADDFAKLVSDGLESSTTAKLSMEMTAGGMVTTATGEIDYRGDQPATSMTMTIPGGGGEVQMIMVDGAMYMTLPIQGQDGWFKLDLSDTGALGDELGSLGGMDLRDTMKTFTEGVESVEEIGTEEVNGVTATHYRVTADPEAMSGVLGDSAADIPETLVYDVWLDEQGRFTKMAADLEESGKMEMNVTDWGTDVSIEAPPADQVQDFPTSMLGG